MKSTYLALHENSIDCTIRKLIITLIDKECFNAILAPVRIPTGESFAYELVQDREKIKHSDGKMYPVEIGAVFWIKVYDMP